MVHKNDLGRVRVLCDRDGCERKFVPRAPLVDYEQTRQRAELYGWVTVDRDGARLDFCPEDRREVDAELRATFEPPKVELVGNVRDQLAKVEVGS